MPLVADSLKNKMKASIKNGMKRVFNDVSGTQGYQAVSEEQWDKMADAISDIAKDIVDALHNEAEVAPGIPVATTGSPAAQAGATVAPGKIL